MKFKSVAAATALAALTVGMMPAAHAEWVKSLGTLGARTLGNSFEQGGILDDHYTFRIGSNSASSGDTGANAFSIWLALIADVDVNAVSVRRKTSHDAWDSWQTDANMTDGISFSSLGAGTYELWLSGVVGLAGGSYSGRINAIASAAPEPETFLMMALGLAGVGAATRRQRKTSKALQ